MASSIKRTSVIWRIGLAVAFVVAIGALTGRTGTAHANGIGFSQGDVFTDIGNGQVNHFSNTGALRDVLNNGTSSSFTTGDCWDASNNLYVTNFSSNSISKFDKNGNLLASVWAAVPGTAESCVFDAAGNMYVGGPGHSTIFKLNASGALVSTIAVQGGNGTGGTDWIDLAADQCTILSADEGSIIKRFNTCTNTQNPDFASGLPGRCFALRIRPNGEVLIACSGEVVRLSAAGAVLQTYPVSGSLFALNLDPDGTSFWTADDSTNQVFRVDIATGAVLASFNGQPNVGHGVFGLAVFGEIVVSVDNTPPSCALTGVIAGPPKQILITVQDSDGGLAGPPNGIVVTTSNNATVSIPSYSAGTTSPVIVTATKIDQTQGASVALQVTDAAGNVTLCDPAVLNVDRSTGKPASMTVHGIAHSEHLVHIYNGMPGVSTLSVDVNGRRFQVSNLKAGQQATIDISSALVSGQNAVTLTASGQPGGGVTVIVASK